MSKQKTYVGIHKDSAGGMTPTGNIIRDAWVFGIIPENETCESWDRVRIESLYDKVVAAWEAYGHLPSRLPPELRERHHKIYSRAIEQARDQGWNPELDDEEDA